MKKDLKKKKTSNRDNGKRDYYSVGKYEVIDIIEAYDLNFNLGNVVKYSLRAGRKSIETSIEDLTKASWYIKRELERIINGKSNKQ